MSRAFSASAQQRAKAYHAGPDDTGAAWSLMPRVDERSKGRAAAAQQRAAASRVADEVGFAPADPTSQAPPEWRGAVPAKTVHRKRDEQRRSTIVEQLQSEERGVVTSFHKGGDP
eukprot:gene32963-4866_t